MLVLLYGPHSKQSSLILILCNLLKNVHIHYYIIHIKVTLYNIVYITLLYLHFLDKIYHAI